MENNPLAFGSTLADYMDLVIPLIIAEVLLLTTFSVLYYMAVYTHVIKNDIIAEKIFLSFRRIRLFVGLGFLASLLLFYSSYLTNNIHSIALRDTGITLFLLVGWCGLLYGFWLYFSVNSFSQKRKDNKK